MKSKVPLPKLQLQHHEDEVIAAAYVAGQQLLAMQPAIRSTSQFTRKADGTIVTEADIVSERILLDAIEMHAPKPHFVVSEESLDGPVTDSATPTWFVDPLDGTRNYVNGSADFAVLISEWVAGTARFSVVYYPALGQLAVAAGGQAAWTSPVVSPMYCADNFPMSVHVCYMRSRELRRVVTEFGGSYREEESESTRALVDVATGAASAAVVLLCGHKSWDLAPLLHLVTAVGGFLGDLAGQSVRISGSEVFGRYVIASRDATLFDILSTAVRELDPRCEE